MTENLSTLQSLLKDIEHGLYLMGPDRVRCLSTHETEDMVVALSEKTKKAIEISQQLGK